MLKENEIWASCYHTLKNYYQKIEEEFEINHDEFGGYRIVYVGQERLASKVVLKNGPTGFLRPIPDHITNLSVLYKFSKQKQKQKEGFLMLGPIRFVNSDCEPNCEYDFTSMDKTIVRLKTKRPINPGEELLVNYSDQFFESHKCLCSTCKQRQLFYNTNSTSNFTDVATQ